MISLHGHMTNQPLVTSPFPSLFRVGQLLVTTLPTAKHINENDISLYDGSDSTHSLNEEEGDGTTEHAQDEDCHDNQNVMDSTEHAQFTSNHDNPDSQRRAIMLRNMLLDVIHSLLMNVQLELNTQ